MASEGLLMEGQSVLEHVFRLQQPLNKVQC